jgi:hypothetical protein
LPKQKQESRLPLASFREGGRRRLSGHQGRVIKAGLRRKAASIRREIVATAPHFRASMTQVNFVSS